MIINWIGSIGQGQGYSGSGENICVALEKMGVDVRLIGLRQSHETNLTPEGLKIKQKPFAMSDIAVVYGLPASFDSSLNWKYRFGFTMFETDKLPAGKAWAGRSGNAADSCNLLTRLFVPSRHNKRLFSDSGVNVPIDIVPLGINPDLFPLMKRSTRKNVFTFLQLGTLSVRKNPGAVLAAFTAVFGKNPNVQLILKTQGGGLRHFQFLDNPNIKIIDRYSTHEEILSYYQQADCFVFPSRGEGFGLPPLEAMSTGLPVIVAKNTGMADYADFKYCYPIRTTKKKPAMHFPPDWGAVGNWYEPDFDELKAAMRHVYENQEVAKKKALLGAEMVREKYTYEQTAKKIVEIISSTVV